MPAASPSWVGQIPNEGPNSKYLCLADHIGSMVQFFSFLFSKSPFKDVKKKFLAHSPYKKQSVLDLAYGCSLSIVWIILEQSL